MKNFILFFCFLTVHNLSAQDVGKNLTMEGTAHFFHQNERKDFLINQLFTAVGTLLGAVTKLDTLPEGSPLLKQVTVTEFIGFTANGEKFSYEKKYIIGQGEGFVFFREEYPKLIGPLYNFQDKTVLASAITQFIKTTASGYVIGKH
jgi:hypothetical protein